MMALAHVCNDILSYPFALFEQAYSLITSGTGAIQATLRRLKRRIYHVFYIPPALNTLPTEMIYQIMQWLNPSEAWALSNSWRDIKEMYTPATRWFALQKKCIELLRQEVLDGNEMETLRRCYRDLWLYLLDPEVSNKDLGHLAALAERFQKHLGWLELQNILMYGVLPRQPSRDFRSQWEKLVQINLYLCAISSELAPLLDYWRAGEVEELLLLLNRDTDFVTDFFQHMGRHAPWGVPYSALNDDAFQEIRLSGLGVSYSTLNDTVFQQRGRYTPWGAAYSTLNDAVNKRFIELASGLLSDDPKLINKCLAKTTALMHMASDGNVRIVRMLLAHGADMKLKDQNGNDALSLARMGNHHDVVQALVEWRMAFLEEKCLALINKIELDRAEKVVLREYYGDMASILLDAATADTELKHTAALLEKCYVHFSSTVRQVFEQKLAQYTGQGLQQQWEKLASVDLRLCVTLTGAITRTKLAKYGINCDFLLARLQTDEAEAFLEALEEVRLFGYSALHTAADERILSVFPVLLQDDRSRINVLDHEGSSILAKAAGRGNVEVVRQILQYRPNVDIRNKDGNSPLLIASENILGERDRSGIVEILLEHGANIEQCTKDGLTPLMVACMFIEENPGSIATVKILLRYGANTEQNFSDGGTVLIRACGREQGTIVQLLLEYGADINATDDEGETALTLAEKSGNADIVQLLKAHQQARARDGLPE